MTVTAREVDADEFPGIHAQLPGWFGPEVQCSPGAWWPSLGQIRRGELVLAAEDGGELIGLGLVYGPDGRLDWMVTKPGRSGEAFLAVATRIVEVYGTGWGHVGNAALREEYLRVCDGKLVQDDPEDPTRLRWVVP